ncbi:MAG: PAS domain-containing protein [Candidatus Diapherotrites archaeon]
MTGKIPAKTLESLLDALPVEISFVDAKETVQYFNRDGARIFPRNKSVIGMKVQNCHSPKSLEKVQAILDGFKKGTLNKVEFWTDLQGKKILISYFPVRDKKGKFLGTLEVTQDITEIQKLKGEKRLL